MKTIYKRLSILFGVTIYLMGCSIDDVVPQNQLVEDTVIFNEDSAVSFLNRIYTTYRDGTDSGTPLLRPEITAKLSASGQELTLLTPDEIADRAIQVDNIDIQSVYQREYLTINNANFFIELVERGDANLDSETRMNELLAEARFFRAYSHFNLLRVFGQFYDRGSEFGIVNRTKPFRDIEANPRNSVQENYDLIISDLQFATDNAQNGREHFYVTETVARAALAKVQLYMGDYDGASVNALAVINNTDGYSLSSTYEGIFSTKFGSETIFAPFTGGSTEGDISVREYAPGSSFPSSYLAELADAQDGVEGDGSPDFLTGYDPRFSLIFGAAGISPKYPFPGSFMGEGNTVNMIRMAEIYLIYAEAEARRSGGNLNDALNRLNDIRNRAGVSPKALVDQASLLEDIRDEKLLELFQETGESWFDFVRYDRLGDISASSINPNISGPDELIFPIPQTAIAGNNQLIQNPGY
ncbi:MAG: RagB/SusD family nutrient uptake outer membrane protein [Bacteroidota bacterium]